MKNLLGKEPLGLKMTRGRFGNMRPATYEKYTNRFEYLEFIAGHHMNSYLGIGDFCVTKELTEMVEIVKRLKGAGVPKSLVEDMKERIDKIIRY